MSDRLNGWKAIAGYFQRDRTTVMRWAKERNLPVHRLPGGKIGGVFALRSELDQWRVEFGEPTEGAPPDPAATPAATELAVEPAGQAQRMRGIAVLAIAACLLGALVWLSGTFGTSQDVAAADSARLHDPALEAKFVGARDAWAERTSASLDASIASLREITAAEPRFAAGHAALAEALLLGGEFGSLPYDRAMRDARIEIDRALAIDASLPEANRADGFVAYWWERDPAKAQAAFSRAIAGSPNNAQTHFWYANILSDNGDHAAALAEFDKARLLEPGSIPIATDHAWALWSAGRVAESKTILERLLARQDTAVMHDSLSHIALAEGDYRGYAGHLASYARLRGDSDSLTLSRAVQQALPRGKDAVLQVVLDDALQDVANGKAPDRVWAAFVASLKSDRDLLLAILDAAERRQEVWGGSGFTSRIGNRWKGDTAVISRLDRLRATSMLRP